MRWSEDYDGRVLQCMKESEEHGKSVGETRSRNGECQSV